MPGLLPPRRRVATALGSAAAALLAALLATPAAIAGPDVLRLANVDDADAGTVVAVPIHLADRAGTTLDAGAGIGSTVQQLSVKVAWTPALAVAGPPSFRRAGVALGPAPLFETEHPGAVHRSWIVAWKESTAPLVLTPGAPGFGDLVGFLDVPLAAGLPDGARVTLTVAAADTALGNAPGDLSERPPGHGNGDLLALGGSILVGDLFSDGFESGDADAWSVAVP